MARFNFNLRSPNAKEETPIHLIIRWQNKRLVYYTGETIHPDYWNKDNQRAKQTKKFLEYPEFNTRLDKIKETAKDVFRRYQNDNNNALPSPTELRKLLKIAFYKESADNTLFKFMDKRIEELKKDYKSKGKKINNLTVVNSYKQTNDVLIKYASHKNRRIDFDSIDINFYQDFIAYMQVEKEYSYNNIGKHIKNLKALLNEATERGLNKNLAYKSKHFKVVKEEIPAIYLTEDEIAELYDLDLSNNKRLERVRNLFIIGCYTGLRFSDLTNIKPTNFIKIRHNGTEYDALHIKMQKTGGDINIPLDTIVLKIKNKYKRKTENSLPEAYSNPKMNKYLKELCAEVDSLCKKVEITRTMAGKKESRMVEKFNLVTTHTARRSFASNMYKKGVPSITLMNITGHKTESAFLTYIRVTPEDHANKMFEIINNK